MLNVLDYISRGCLFQAASAFLNRLTDGFSRMSFRKVFSFPTLPNRTLMINRLLLLLLLVVNSNFAFSQTGVELSTDSLVRLLQRGENDSIRRSANNLLDQRVYQFLLSDSSCSQKPNLSPNLSWIISPDGNWRIVTWVLPNYDGSRYSFYGYLQKQALKSSTNRIWRLVDSTDVIRKPESEKLSTDRWLGAAYYDVIAKKKNGKAVYTLLGWKAKDASVTQKVIEVLSFDGDRPRFGYPLFKRKGVFRSRIMFTFSAQVSMSLRYESSKRMIVFDHLSSSTPNSESTDFSQAGPDGTYAAYRFRSGRWNYMENITMKLAPIKR